MRKIPFWLILLIAISAFFNSTFPYPYNIYALIVLVSYPIAMELLGYFLPRNKKARIPFVFLFALIPPVWEGIWMSLFFAGKPPIASYDVLLGFLWMVDTVLLYIYAFAVLLIEIFSGRRSNG